MKRLRLSFFVAVIVILVATSAAAGKITLYAAGSLRSALGDVAAAFEQSTGNVVTTEFAPSGLLRQRIEQGENVNVFASANMEHPMTLVSNGQKGPVVLFARNNLCALAQPAVKVSPSSMLEVLLDPETRVGTSTPRADPSGDYAWELFQRADKVEPGSFKKLSGKALQLTGGPDSPAAPLERNQYAWVMDEDRADIFLTYCTNAVLAKKELSQLQIIHIPQELAVGADYGLIVLDGSPEEAWRFAMFILSPEGQSVLSDHGFIAEALPVK
ncbi:molybdate ABC transporter substrate-binding protein [Desulfonatronovibrio hydrogenovorans]|uniref:molybdate ABC transporter substrate-binding protein n=1 Tax=Desulfonatronovibrio hydrogenovorans TaxID=53245 RepID=UPI00048EF2CB|nr:molybdate ABC transporter substrate-binding protein [Desulfonatronovibrio hydrogenovorans]